ARGARAQAGRASDRQGPAPRRCYLGCGLRRQSPPDAARLRDRPLTRTVVAPREAASSAGVDDPRSKGTPNHPLQQTGAACSLSATIAPRVRPRLLGGVVRQNTEIVRGRSHRRVGSSMGVIWDYFRYLLGWPYSPRGFVVRLFPGVKPVLLTGLFARVTRLELNEVGAVVDLNLNQQAAMCVKSGELESVKLTNGVWQAFWHSTPGTVFNTDGLWRKLKGTCMCRVAKPTTLMLLSAEDFEAELKVNQPLSEAL